MNPPDRPTVSRRHLVRALLGRDIPPAGQAPGQPAPAPHAAGDAAFAAGDFAGAVAAYRASVRADLSNLAVRTRLGQALYLLGQHIQARVEFEHVLRLSEGTDVTARLGLALTCLALDKPAKAAGLLEALADADYPELEALAKSTAAALTADSAQPDLDAPRRDLERLARAGGLLPEVA
jgi:tetratricopeptide (TPR) repeat protein